MPTNPDEPARTFLSRPAAPRSCSTGGNRRCVGRPSTPQQPHHPLSHGRVEPEAVLRHGKRHLKAQSDGCSVTDMPIPLHHLDRMPHRMPKVEDGAHALFLLVLLDYAGLEVDRLLHNGRRSSRDRAPRVRGRQLRVVPRHLARSGGHASPLHPSRPRSRPRIGSSTSLDRRRPGRADRRRPPGSCPRRGRWPSCRRRSSRPVPTGSSAPATTPLRAGTSRRRIRRGRPPLLPPAPRRRRHAGLCAPRASSSRGRDWSDSCWPPRRRSPERRPP